MKKISVLFVITMVMFLALTPLAAATNGSTGSIVRIAGNIVVEKDQVVHGDVVSVFGNVQIHGTVYGDVVTVLGNAEVSSTGSVLGDAVSVLGNLETAHGSSIAGSKVNVVGINNFRSIPIPSLNLNLLTRRAFNFNLVNQLLKLITNVLLAVLIVALFPVPVTRVLKGIEGNPGRMVLIGLLAWVIIIPLTVLVALTIIGIPIAILLGIAVWIAGRLGTAALAIFIGRALLKDTQSEPAVAAVGALLMGAVTMIPIVGGMVGLVVSLVTLGAVAVTRFGTRDEVVA